jgi:hypothetical protein
MRRFATPALTLLLAFAASCSSSGAGHINRPTTIDEFVKSYVASMNARDLAANRALWHSKSLACITPDSSVFYDRAFKISSRHGIPADYKFTAKPIGPDEKLAFEGYAIYPVRPAEEVQINYTRGLENSGSVVLWLAQEGKGWAEVFPCVSPEILQKFKKDLPDIKAHEEKIKALVDSLEDPLRSELLALLKEGKSSTAAARYAEAAKQDRATAMYVIEEVEYRLENTTTPK